ncbi:M15 family metallopeptidase [Exiguobacterium alkaliphilum]|uniref:M15 family metallopeptidase n=1 Tax=Exiguobacterium alkaliphilum TaxID=1428684 RepID=UPI001BA5F696|nr:M15 family metallopeptidase [Exiguobacterium alkaliphilum]QUE85604.1 M15 family metallopeptidase [Exiguobacterium alkaliphilum]
MKWTGVLTFAMVAFLVGIFLAYSFSRPGPMPWVDEPSFEAGMCNRAPQAEQPIVERSERAFSNLHPHVRERSETFVRLAYSCLGLEVRLTSGYRSEDEQNALYAQGRSEPGQIVTNAKAGQSYHNYGLAVDFVIIHDNRADYDLSSDHNRSGVPDWQELGELGKALGFEWGGDWRDFPDYPHLQMDFGLSIRQLAAGKRPGEQATMPLADVLKPLVD